MFKVVESAPNFLMGSLCALDEIPTLNSLEMSNAAEREFFFFNYPLIMSFLRVFRGVELVCTFFIGSLSALNEIPALKRLEMPNAAERDFFLCNLPHIMSCLEVFGGVQLVFIFL